MELVLHFLGKEGGICEGMQIEEMKNDLENIPMSPPIRQPH